MYIEMNAVCCELYTEHKYSQYTPYTVHSRSDYSTISQVTVHSGQSKFTVKSDVHVTVHRDKFLIISQLDALIYQNFFLE